MSPSDQSDPRYPCACCSQSVKLTRVAYHFLVPYVVMYPTPCQEVHHRLYQWAFNQSKFTILVFYSFPYYKLESYLNQIREKNLV
jgi:hypothetical protein